MASPLNRFLLDMLNEKSEQFGTDLQVVEIVSDEAHLSANESTSSTLELPPTTSIDEEDRKDREGFVTLKIMRNEPLFSGSNLHKTNFSSHHRG